MQSVPYAETMCDSPALARAREREAFDHGIEMLERVKEKADSPIERIEALRYIQKLWGFLISDLTDPQNALPERLRADLISIGLWVIREADQLMAGSKTRLDALIDINKTVRDGLS